MTSKEGCTTLTRYENTVPEIPAEYAIHRHHFRSAAILCSSHGWWERGHVRDRAHLAVELELVHHVVASVQARMSWHLIHEGSHLIDVYIPVWTDIVLRFGRLPALARDLSRLLDPRVDESPDQATIESRSVMRISGNALKCVGNVLD